MTSRDEKQWSKGRAATHSKLRPASFTPPVRSAEPELGERLDELRRWLSIRGWQPFAFREELWSAATRGLSGLVHTPARSGKTYAASFLGLARCMVQRQGLGMLALSPSRASARRLAETLNQPLMDLGWPLRIELRCPDCDTIPRPRARKSAPHLLVTTPEWLALALTAREGEQTFSELHSLLLDDWHELVGHKRGALLELSLAQLRALTPQLCTWASSAPLAAPESALRQAIGHFADGVILADLHSNPGSVSAELGARPAASPQGSRAERKSTTSTDRRATRPLVIESVLPCNLERFAYPDRLGLCLIGPLLERIDTSRSTVFFVESRSAAERWYQGLAEACPQLGDALALHHSALDSAEREQVEKGLRGGALRWVVCCPSSESGIELDTVEQVVQIGAPKRIATLLRRAGRSAPGPLQHGRIFFVPNHALELFEVIAMREAIEDNEFEAERELDAPSDVLMQHLLNRSLGDGFRAQTLFDEVRSTHSFRELPRERFDSLLLACTTGGALHAYSEYRRLERSGDHYLCSDPQLARLQRSNIGILAQSGEVELRSLSGKRLGSVEAGFVARLRRGDRFLFGGRCVELSALRDHIAYVKTADTKRGALVAQWSAQPLAPSALLQQALQRSFERIAASLNNPQPRLDNRRNKRTYQEMTSLQGILETQARLSRWPRADQLLLESWSSSDGEHLFFYPLAGRAVHEAIAALLSRRLDATLGPCNPVFTCNDFGIEIFCRKLVLFEEHLGPESFDFSELEEQLMACPNSAQLARQCFRNIARISSMVFEQPPCSSRRAPALNANASMLFDVFERYQPEHPLMQQSRREVLEQQFELEALLPTLQRLRRCPFEWLRLAQPSPLAFPLLVERTMAEVSNEPIAQRLEMLRARLGVGP